MLRTTLKVNPNERGKSLYLLQLRKSRSKLSLTNKTQSKYKQGQRSKKY